MEENKPLRPFFALWGGQALSLVGSQAVHFALVWWLAEKTGSAAVLATVTLVGVAPQIALGPVIGALVDRWDRKRVMLVSDAAVAAASAMLALLFVVGEAAVVWVILLFVVRSIGTAFHGPAMAASTSLMVPQRHLVRVQGLNQSLHGGQLVLSAPLGALLLGALPMAGIMAVDVATAALAILPLSFVRVPRPNRTDETHGTQSLWRDTRDGFEYLFTRRGHGALLALCMLVNLCMVPAFSLLPLLVSERGGGAGQLGAMHAVFGIASILGGIVLSLGGGFRRRVHTLLAACPLMGLGTASLALSLSSGLPYLSMGMVGFFLAFANGPIIAIVQATIPPEYQGRAQALYRSAASLMTPVGLFLAAPVADMIGVEAWYIAAGAMCIGAGVGGFLSPSLLRIEGDIDPDHGGESPSS